MLTNKKLFLRSIVIDQLSPADIPLLWDALRRFIEALDKEADEAASVDDFVATAELARLAIFLQAISSELLVRHGKY